MKTRKRHTLFATLMFSVALPEIIIFSTVAIFSYLQLKGVFQEISEEKVENFREELLSIIDFQDVSLTQISHNIDHSAQEKMKKLRYEYFLTSDSIETANLERLRSKIGMHHTDDIYIINRDGIVVNTTFKDDLNFDLFSISSEFKEFLLDLFTHDLYIPQPMSLETNTRKFKKYIYQSSKDREYIIQLGFYSNEAERFNKVVSQRLNDIQKAPNDIESIDLIVAPWNPISFYTKENVDSSDHELIQEIFNKREGRIIELKNKSISYLYFERDDTEAIRWEGILKVNYDKERNKEILTSTLVQKLSLFGIGVGLLFLILFFNVRAITKPVRSLSLTAMKLGWGELDQRAKAGGTREIERLSEAFNHMADNLETSHKEITKKNEEITASITYAKRIQEAILPSDFDVKESLPEHFIYYRPKDIVAGDFFWHEKIGDEVFIAAADCTGHGVPGAMVSVVCSNSLNQAVKELKLREPADILNMVRQLVIETFDKSHHDVKDGMDICFCRVNLKKREVVFSGAQNNLYRFTKKSGNIDNPKAIFNDKHMLVEYKANKQPIGKFTHEKPFTQEVIQCEKGDYLYLFTDGYADQFGGPEGRKFMYKPFKRLLLSFYDMEMDKQSEALNKAFEEWMVNESQIDDVCVIGIRV